MIKAMEAIIAKYNCSHIEGLFSPFGKFKNGAEIFYDRNNFTIHDDAAMGGLKFIYKDCQSNLLKNNT